VAFKKMVKILAGSIAMILIFFAILILPQDVPPDQHLPDSVLHEFPDTLANETYNWDSLEVLMGPDKQLPPQFEKAALIAYSVYPELKDAKIKMVLTSSGAPMESNFELLTLLQPRSERVYEIRLNNAKESMFDGILMRDLPFDAQVGILAHELAHVVYYENLSSLQIANLCLKYLLSMDFRARHERSTDMMPIYYGLGTQLYQYAWFVRYDVRNQAMYQKWGSWMDRFYLKDTEILQIMSTLVHYNPSMDQAK
jgi:hypothetical protein